MVEVTQADHDAAQEYMRLFPDLRLPEAFARHRTRATRQDGLPHDLFSHRAAWRRALVIVTEAASPPWHDVDDRAYWQHEIDVFDHVFAALSASPEGEGK